MYRTVLAPVDGSDTSETVLRHAITLADRYDATLHVLTVVEPPRSRMAFGVDEVEEINEAVTDLTDHIVAAGGPEGVDIDYDIVRDHSPHEAILDYIAEIDADVVVVGRRGTTSLPAAILGSTSDRLARLSPVPVILVPGPETA